jgi:hypothetical protein
MGSSSARGALVSYQDSFAARASVALTHDCHQLVDFQNLGTEASDMSRLDLRIGEALSLKPSAIVITVAQFDLIHIDDPVSPTGQEEESEFKPSIRNIVLLLRESRLFLLMQYYLYRDPDFQIKAFLLNGDPADSVRAPLSAAWSQRVADFGKVLDRIVKQTGPANVPVLLFFMPDRAQAALAANRTYPPGVDPYVLGRELATAASYYGVGFTDSTQAFADYPDFQSMYYLTDGHPSVGGHAALAGDVVKSLLAVPAFAACKRTSPEVLGSNLP